MLTALIGRSVRDRRRALVWWSLGTSLFALINVVSYPAVRDTAGFDQMMEEFSPELMAAFTGGDTSLDFTSPAGYLNSQLTALLLPLLLIILAVGVGAGLAVDEEDGTLDLLLSHPVRRREGVLARIGSMKIQVIVVLTVTFAVVFAAGALVELTIDPGGILASWFGQLMLGLLFGAMAVAVAAWTGERGAAIGVPAAVAASTYLITALSPSVSWLESLDWLSPFTYATGGNPLANGLDVIDVVVLIGAVLVVTGLAVVGIGRRDLRT